MCLLSDWEIKEYVQTQKLRIEPFNESNLTPNGIDLCVNEIWVEGREPTKNSCEVPPLTRFMVSTLEFISMPENLAGMLWIKTSLARKGIVGSFGIVDAGFEGRLTLAFYNASYEKVVIAPGSKVVQLVLLRHSPSQKLYPERSGHYQNQDRITFSREEGKNIYSTT